MKWISFLMYLKITIYAQGPSRETGSLSGLHSLKELKMPQCFPQRLQQLTALPAVCDAAQPR